MVEGGGRTMIHGIGVVMNARGPGTRGVDVAVKALLLINRAEVILKKSSNLYTQQENLGKTPKLNNLSHSTQVSYLLSAKQTYIS